MNKLIEQEVAEQATGCWEHRNGLGTVYAVVSRHEGTKLNDALDIMEWMADGSAIAVPNAGSGSYGKVFHMCGMVIANVFEQSSSAGDWSFAVYDGHAWYPAFQTNRYPYHGFEYCIDFSNKFPSEDACMAWMAGE